MKTYILGIAALVSMADKVTAQVDVEVPRLVVNVIIDQLRSDYLEAFAPLYGTDGFAKLMGEGRVYTRAEYPFLGPDRASAVACLMTGTVPYENGIVGEQWFDRTTLQTVCCVDDKRFKGNSTAECTSPQYLAVSTLTDELKVTSGGSSLVYAIAPERDAAVFSAGHSADGCFWMNDFTGQWCTSSYYNPVPTWLSFYNNSRGMQKSLPSITWEPALNVSAASWWAATTSGTREPFSHSFSDETTLRSFKASAMVNEEVTRFALHVVRNGMLGVDQVTDFLSVTYYAGNFDHKAASECRMEVQDTYVRLDAELASLIDAVEAKVGKGRVLFVLTSTGYTDDDRADEDLSEYRIPTGEVSFTRAYLLLNMYLTAVYGQGQYVLAASGNQIYLDQKLIENKSLDLNEVLERSASFLIQMDGVRDVYTSQRLMLDVGTSPLRSLRNAYNPKASGDIIIEIAPGWRLVNENTDERVLQRRSYLGFPLIFWGSGIEPGKVDDPVTIDHVAPTIAAHLRIRAPNACSASPLNLR
ncbi:MAG: alkaline phosphatase family protein [Prevotellaceae bacterium]|nr:alkaline phosphatase family protein [Prevotellaceae bacterium]